MDYHAKVRACEEVGKLVRAEMVQRGISRSTLGEELAEMLDVEKETALRYVTSITTGSMPTSVWNGASGWPNRLHAIYDILDLDSTHPVVVLTSTNPSFQYN